MINSTPGLWERKMILKPDGRTVAEVIDDPATPAWIKRGIEKLRRDNPVYAVFLEWRHNYINRSVAQPE